MTKLLKIKFKKNFLKRDSFQFYIVYRKFLCLDIKISDNFFLTKQKFNLCNNKIYLKKLTKFLVILEKLKKNGLLS